MKTLIGVPTRGQISLGATEFLSKQDNDVYYGPSMISVVHARMKIVDYFLKNSYDALLFLDDDVAPPLGVVSALSAVKQPVVSANYPICRDGHIKSAAYTTERGGVWEASYQHEFGESGIKKVDGIGLGCCLIQKDVLRALGINFHMRYDGSKLIVGEDLDFSTRAVRAGFDIYYNFNCICDHYKVLSLRTVWDKYCV